jgi:hypothetical protein
MGESERGRRTQGLPVANANVGVLGDLLVGLLGSLVGGALDLVCGGMSVMVLKRVVEGGGM